MTEEETLGQTGQILVTQAAADAYAGAGGLGFEEARRELTTLLTGARRSASQPTSGAEGWRARSRTLDVDVDAHVSREGGLAVVVHVHIRSRRERRRVQ